jgi:hypothetical protein
MMLVPPVLSYPVLAVESGARLATARAALFRAC